MKVNHCQHRLFNCMCQWPPHTHVSRVPISDIYDVLSPGTPNVSKSNTWLLWHTKVCTLNWEIDQLSSGAGLMVLSNTHADSQTDHDTYNICSNSLHLAICWQCGLNIMKTSNQIWSNLAIRR